MVTSKDKDAGGTYLTAELLLEHLQQASKLPILPLHCPQPPSLRFPHLILQ